MVASWLYNEAHGEDNLVVTDRVVAVLDGVSATDGRTASSTVKLALEEAKSVEGVKKALAEAHDALQGKAALTTVAGLFLGDGVVTAFAVGDSPIYHIPTAINKVLPLDRDGVAVTQTIGDGDYRLHNSTLPMHGRFLLMTDGVSDNLSPRELDSCAHGTDEETVERVKALLAEKKRKNEGHVFPEYKEDDCALIVIGFSES